MRPGYPAELFDDIRTYAKLAPDDPILELGAGTGKATIVFANWGNPLIAIEPAPAMADVARRNLASLANPEVRTSRFEDADLPPNTFGLVATAQAWHWLDEATRIDRIADVLYAHGTAAIIGNVQYVTDESRPFFERVQDVYREFTPRMAHEGDFRTVDDMPKHPLGGSSRFEDFVQAKRQWEWTLDGDAYIALMATHSNHAALDGDTRRRLHAGIKDLIDEDFGGAVTENYVAVAGLARRT